MPKGYTKVEDLREKPDEYLECFDTGHLWHRLGIFLNSGSHNGIIRRFFCIRCTTHRDDYFYRHNNRCAWYFYGRRYFYPDGYLKQGEGRVAKLDIQQESIRRVFVLDDVLTSEDDLPAEPEWIGRS